MKPTNSIFSAGLLQSAGAARLAPYREALNYDDSLLESLYRWNSDVSLAFFDDIGVVEIAMRNAISRELAADHGLKWFEKSSLFDDDTMKILTAAQLNCRSPMPPSDGALHDRLVARLMFGLWLKLLGRGSYQGLAPKSIAPVKKRVIYDSVLWRPTLYRAFPGVEPGARARVETAAASVKYARNRIAHHESVVWGIPLAGQRDRSNQARRLTLNDTRNVILELAGYIDPQLRAWVDANSRVAKAIDTCPAPDRTRFSF